MKRSLKLSIIIIFLVLNFLLSEDVKHAGSENINNIKLMKEVLEGSADYCSRLRNRAFHFVCNEKIVEVLDEIEPAGHGSRRVFRKKSTRSYQFDYQLISDQSGITEQRKKLNDQNTRNNDIHDLLISFLSEKPVFAPFMILGKLGQVDFRIVLNDQFKKGGNEIVRIEALPKTEKKYFFKNALIDINRRDFSVRRIRVIPRYIKGFNKLMNRTFQFRTRLYLESLICFDKEFNGLWFPTMITISERYKGGRFVTQHAVALGWERNRTEFKYTDYKFFNVDMDIKN